MIRIICIGTALAALTSCAETTDCQNWTTYEFFEDASVQDVAGCLSTGASVNAVDRDGGTPLHLAAMGTENPDVIKALIAVGADVNARDLAQRTPLHWAALINDNPSVFVALIDAGADVNAQDVWGQTPLHEANVVSNNTAVIKVLTDAGAQ
ncbi:ankyrin repeat domain-containing protein [Yoonia sediminilitoris]|uniref:Ankyrin repeat protein n=1 Tax=Yoonia sediminilitoris TaxID=1286148 RepID=A0A2T6KMA5_9RHOB|nr:ankyrin repeat domain-containing protein [Yoonia sediminilitoris]PUB17343.1 ankyrin repeat protein [Yoonia sediminilitoris]RCW97638.1 ankyrin repeat protein [Yoonia sediminilitoris]